MSNWKRACIAVVLLLAVGCRKSPPLNLAEPGGSVGQTDPHAVQLHLVRVQGVKSFAGEWRATYMSNGRAIPFNIRLDPPRGSGQFAFGDGQMSADPGVDAAPLLTAIAQSLEAKSVPAAAKSPSVIKFTYASLGEGMSRDAGGGFSASPHGDWIALKLFLPAGDDPAEVFFNLNPAIGEAELSEKDADYGDAIAKDFAAIF